MANLQYAMNWNARNNLVFAVAVVAWWSIIDGYFLFFYT